MDSPEAFHRGFQGECKPQPLLFYCQMFVAEPFPGLVNLKEVAALTMKFIRFDYLFKIYIQKLCEHPLWGVSKNRKDWGREVKIIVQICGFLIYEVFKRPADSGFELDR